MLYRCEGQMTHCLFHLNFCQISKSNFSKSQFTSPNINIYLQIQWLISLINSSLRTNIFENKLFFWGNYLLKSCYWLSKWINLDDIWTMFWNLIRNIALMFTFGKQFKKWLSLQNFRKRLKYYIYTMLLLKTKLGFMLKD